MEPLVFQNGVLEEPHLHDAFIYRIDFGGREISLYCSAPGGQRTRVEFRGVAHMLGTGLAEQNLVLDVELDDDSSSISKALSRLLPGEGAAQRSYRDDVFNKVMSGNLKLFHVSPSYGGEILVLCEEAGCEGVV